jgi:hypothetical protein
MKILARLSRVTLIGTLLFSSLLAQETPAASSTPAAQPPVWTPPKPELMTIDFPGGTLGQLIAVLNKAKSPFNMIAEKSDQDVEIPAFSLRNVHAQAVADAIGQWLFAKGYVLGSRGWNDGSQGNPVYFISKDPKAKQTSSSFIPFQLWPQLEYQSIDDIVAAIRAAWDLDPAHTPSDLKLKFHPPTSVLLVVGPPQAIEVAQRVIAALKYAPGHQLPPPKSKEADSPKT